LRIADVPAPLELTPVSHIRVAPRDASERIVAAVWEEVLGRSEFGVTESFYELGGDTTAANRASELLAQRTGHPVGAGELFSEPTVEHQAALLR
jgi:hypothetical protein